MFPSQLVGWGRATWIETSFSLKVWVERISQIPWNPLAFSKTDSSINQRFWNLPAAWSHQMAESSPAFIWPYFVLHLRTMGVFSPTARGPGLCPSGQIRRSVLSGSQIPEQEWSDLILQQPSLNGIHCREGKGVVGAETTFSFHLEGRSWPILVRCTNTSEGSTARVNVLLFLLYVVL